MTIRPSGTCSAVPTSRPSASGALHRRYTDGVSLEAATDPADIVATLSARDDLTITAPKAIELGGMQGQQFDLVTTQPKTPVFFGPAGDFRLDPEFKTGAPSTSPAEGSSSSASTLQIPTSRRPWVWPIPSRRRCSFSCHERASSALTTFRE